MLALFPRPYAIALLFTSLVAIACGGPPRQMAAVPQGKRP
jgi:hypothetical protein